MAKVKTSSFYSENGRIGGRAGKGSAKKKASATAAAHVRWSRRPDRVVKLTMCDRWLTISRNVPGLKVALSYYERKTVDGKIVAKRESALFKDGATWCTFPTLLDRVKEFFIDASIQFKVVWKSPEAYKEAECDIAGAAASFNYRDQRCLKRLLKLPVGGLCRIPDERRVDVMVAALEAFQKVPAVVVIEELELLLRLRKVLQHRLRRPIGILTKKVQDSENVTVMTPAYLKSGVINRDNCAVLIFERVPRLIKSQRLTDSLLHFHPLWKLGFLGDETRGPDRRFLAELMFGPVVSFGASDESEPEASKEVES
jgi:hypothetical protein